MILYVYGLLIEWEMNSLSVTTSVFRFKNFVFLTASSWYVTKSVAELSYSLMLFVY